MVLADYSQSKLAQPKAATIPPVALIEDSAQSEIQTAKNDSVIFLPIGSHDGLNNMANKLFRSTGTIRKTKDGIQLRAGIVTYRGMEYEVEETVQAIFPSEDGHSRFFVKQIINSRTKRKIVCFAWSLPELIAASYQSEVAV